MHVLCMQLSLLVVVCELTISPTFSVEKAEASRSVSISGVKEKRTVIVAPSAFVGLSCYAMSQTLTALTACT